MININIDPTSIVSNFNFSLSCNQIGTLDKLRGKQDELEIHLNNPKRNAKRVRWKQKERNPKPELDKQTVTEDHHKLSVQNRGANQTSKLDQLALKATYPSTLNKQPNQANNLFE